MASSNTNRTGPSQSSTQSGASAAGSKKKECYVFEPQQWRRSVCKNCFRSQPDHPTGPPPGSSGGEAKSGLSPRTSPLLASKSGAGASDKASTKGDTVMRKSETSPGSRRRPKSDEFKQKTPSPREVKRSLTIGSSGSGSGTAGGRKSPASTSPSSSTTNVAAASSARGALAGHNRQSSTSSIDTKYVEELENDFFDLEDKYDELAREKTEIEKEVSEKCRTIEDLHEDIEAYKNKIVHFERRVQHLEEEIRSYRERLKLPESDQASGGDAADEMSGEKAELLAENEQLRVRLDEIEQLCQEVMEENEVLKEEQEEMQREIEEMHDHFQEDDTDTLREMKRDLESSNKNCRIFQFKLRKTERRYEQCENERANLEEKLSRLEAQLYSETDVNLIRGLEEELRVAKEVSVRLNSELELVDEKRAYFEEDNKHLKEELKDSDSRRKNLESELSRCRQEIEKLKSMEPSGALQIPETTSMRRGTKKAESLSREPSFEEQSLQRELDAAKERETDLNEQLKFSEDDIHKMKRRLNDAEEENDSLSKKLESLMKNKNLEESDFEDASVHALKIQVDLLEQENSALRKKFVAIERENLKLINDLRQIKSKNGDGGSSIAVPDLEKRVMSLQADLERVERENRRLSILNQLSAGAGPSGSLVSGANKQRPEPSVTTGASATTAGVAPTAGGSGQKELSTEFIQAAQLLEVQQECAKLKERVRQYDKTVKSILSQMQPQETDKRQLDVFRKYTESVAVCREQERTVLELRRVVETLQEECTRYKQQAATAGAAAAASKTETKESRSDTKSDLEHASKPVLLEEIVCLEEEIDDLASKCEKAECKIAQLTDTVTEKEKIIDEMLLENERNEKELNQYIDHLLSKNALLSDLLNCVETRANELQLQFDRSISADESGDSSSESNPATTTTATTTNTDQQSLGGLVSLTTRTAVANRASTGSDDVFNDPSGFQINVPGNLNDAEKIKFRLSCMERLLSEERKRTRIAEKQAEMALKDSAHSRVSDDSQLKKKEIEMLKSDLDEKNEMLEEKEQHIGDLKVRLEQTRKMNEALRTLLDKQDETPTSSGLSYLKGKDTLSKEQMIEINSYKKEVSGLKNELHQYVIKINESEKIREKLAKEIRNLQAEVKIREEQIYEQDDELRAKDQELRSLRKIADEASRSTRGHSDVEDSLTVSMTTSVREAKIDFMQKEIETLTSNLQSYKSHIEELELELRREQNERRVLAESVRTRDDRIKEKDDLISHMGQRLQHRERELSEADSMTQQAAEKLVRSEEQLKTAQRQLSEHEMQMTSLQSKLDEAQNSLQTGRTEAERLRARLTELETAAVASRSGGNSVAVAGNGGTAAEASERLRAEVHQLRRDKEALSVQLSKEKTAARRDSGAGGTKQSESEAYTRAIQQQQYVTRVGLLTDNVTRLNRQNIELKLQNEAVQNEMLEYQRRYKNIREQHQSDQETWVTERITLESRMKEHEDRKSVIAGLRKSLQEASLKVADLEAQMSKERQQTAGHIDELEQKKADLQRRLGQLEEQQKLPKVLQRFGGSKLASRAMGAAGLAVADSVGGLGDAQMRVRLETTEKTVARLRTELADREEKLGAEKAELMRKNEETRARLDGLVQSLTDQLAEMEGCREHVYLLRERLCATEDMHERDRRIWTEERMCLQFRVEDSRLMISSWLTRLRDCENDDYKNCSELICALEKELDKYVHCKESVPYSQMRRRDDDEQLKMMLSLSRINLSSSSSQHDSALHLSSVPGSPARPLMSQQSGVGSRGAPSPVKAVSLDWTNRLWPHSSMSQSSTSDVVGSNQSLAPRSNRSVSPDCSSSMTRKITNYPDPTPGFLLKPSSRQNSAESVSGKDDYTLRSFTLPGLRNNRNVGRTSPARQKFFETPGPTNTGSNSSLSTKPASSLPPSSAGKSQSSNLSLPQSKPPTGSPTPTSTPTPTPSGFKSDKKTDTKSSSVSAEKKTEDLKKKEELKKKEDLKKAEDLKKKEEAKKKEDLKKAEDLKKKEEAKKKDEAKKTTAEPTAAPAMPALKPVSKTQDAPLMKTTKSKSISIAPSIQQLRLRFAQKPDNASSFDAATSSKK